MKITADFPNQSPAKNGLNTKKIPIVPATIGSKHSASTRTAPRPRTASNIAKPACAGTRSTSPARSPRPRRPATPASPAPTPADRLRNPTPSPKVRTMTPSMLWRSASVRLEQLTSFLSSPRTRGSTITRLDPRSRGDDGVHDRLERTPTALTFDPYPPLCRISPATTSYTPLGKRYSTTSHAR